MSRQPKPPLPRYCEYFESEIEGRRCWVQKSDTAIMSGLVGHITGTATRLYRDLPEDALIVKLLCYPKWNTGGGKKLAATSLGQCVTSSQEKPRTSTRGQLPQDLPKE